ncbi:hypothetical protein TTRE_0000006501 [Trichuris trichiura]|uniref:Uncharacterized protein n=1 Tax=Trichuris trichiura TaxID=36087 RepID=A0A077YVL0_TRITR|nr:hypothetical protein TTRE_0000006501 [Trichuris trichiura]
MKKEVPDKAHNQIKSDYFGNAFLLLDGCLFVGIACALIFAPQRLMDTLLVRIFQDHFNQFNFELSDGVHWHMARCLGAVFLSQAAVSLMWLWSDDGACCSSVLTSRLQSLLWIEGLLIAECLLLLCVLFYKRFEIGSTLLTPAQLTYNALSQIDSLLATVIGAVWFAMPDWILYRQVKFPLNDSHIFVSRLFGAYLMATSVYSSRCLYYKTKTDRRVWVCGRAAVSSLYAHAFYGRDSFLKVKFKAIH